MRRTRRRILIAASLTAVLVGATALEVGAAIRARRVVGGLNFPAAFTMAPGKRIFIGEKNTGRVRIYNRATKALRTFTRFDDVSPAGERGLLGIALHPDYASNRLVYVYVTRNVGGTVRNQIVRMENVGGKGKNRTVVYSAPSGATNHQGGRILFGPDGNLYAIVGDGGSPANSQDTSNPLGSVLRMTPNGAGVAGNVSGRVWAYGIRNSFGFAFDPKTGRMWETENGPECNDELNRIVPGRNHGWGPNETCSGAAPRNTNQDGPNPVLPKRWYTPTIAPTGIAFCVRCHLGAKHGGKLFFGASKNGHVRRVVLTGNRRGVQAQKVAYDHPAQVFSMEVGPDRAIYFSDAGSIYRLIRR